MEVHVWLSDNVSQRNAIDSIEPIIIAMRWAAAVKLRPVGMQAGNGGIILKLPTAIVVIFRLDGNDSIGRKGIEQPRVGGPFAIRVKRKNRPVVNGFVLK